MRFLRDTRTFGILLHEKKRVEIHKLPPLPREELQQSLFKYAFFTGAIKSLISPLGKGKPESLGGAREMRFDDPQLRGC